MCHTGPAGVGATEAGTSNRRQGQRENLGRSHTARIWATVRAPVRFGPRRTACSKLAHGFGSGPAEQGHPRVDHPWGYVRDEAYQAIQRLTGQVWKDDRQDKAMKAWWRVHGSEFVKKCRTEK